MVNTYVKVCLPSMCLFASRLIRAIMHYKQCVNLSLSFISSSKHTPSDQGLQNETVIANVHKYISKYADLNRKQPPMPLVWYRNHVPKNLKPLSYLTPFKAKFLD